jgi:hypothetical protein
MSRTVEISVKYTGESQVLAHRSAVGVPEVPGSFSERCRDCRH